ncbi:MAG: response regulator [Pirellulales bacterium]|nr:response regulator [Pirellulales bacterium]
MLLIEDEQEIRRFLRVSLTSAGFDLTEAEDGQDGLRQAAMSPPDIVVLDLGLPDIDGMAVLSQLREWSHVPVIVLSARGREFEKVQALDAGADDYLTKPFGLDELLARLRVSLRHVNKRAGSVTPQLRVRDLEIDLDARRTTMRGQELRLTPIEYRLLAFLARHAGKVLTHRQLLKEVWGPDSVHETHYLRVYMTGLRRKIEDEPARPKYLLTEPGVGYRLAAE